MADSALQVVSPGSQIQTNQPQTFAPRTLDEAFKFADVLIQSKMIPKGYVDKPPAAIVVAIQFGMELGMQPMQSLQNIANINGNPGVWGDAALALVLSSGMCEYYQEDDFETIKKNKKATFVVKRRGFPKEKVTTFSYEDAVTAGIFTNAVWKTYPPRMCQMRARSFGLRDSFPDVLKGMPLAEELQDYPGATIEGNSQQSSASTSTPAAEPAKPEETIGMPGGNNFFKLYSGNGWTPKQSLEFLTTIGIVEPKSSRDIPISEWTTVPSSEWGKGVAVPGGRAWQWVNSPSPIKVKVTEKFDVLGLNADERREFFTANMGEKKAEMYVNVDKALDAEIDKRNAQEQ